MPQFKDHFSSVASHYAEFRPHYPPELFAYLASLCERRNAAWDCGCGSGQAATALAEHFERVIATDASSNQIEAAQPHPRVEYRVAPAEGSGLATGCADLVTVAQALHWFDLGKFYSEARRVLAPRAVLAVWSYGVQHLEEVELDRPVQHFYANVVGPYWPPERAHTETGYRDLPFPFEELRPPQFELRERWPLAHLLGYFRSWSATSRYVKDKGVDPVVALGEELARLWGDPDEPRLVSWPLALRVGRT